MAGWISSKLKVAETFLQQIDQQAAESLGKNEKLPSDDLNFRTPPKTSEVVPLKDQLKKKSEENIDFGGKLRSDRNLNAINNNNSHILSDSIANSSISSYTLNRDKDIAASVHPKSKSNLTDGDWTELLSIPDKKASPAVSPSNGVSGIRALKKDAVRKGGSGVGFGLSSLDGNRRQKVQNNVLKSSRKADDLLASKLDYLISDAEDSEGLNSIKRDSSVELVSDVNSFERKDRDLKDTNNYIGKDDAIKKIDCAVDTVGDGEQVDYNNSLVDTVPQLTDENRAQNLVSASIDSVADLNIETNNENNRFNNSIGGIDQSNGGVLSLHSTKGTSWSSSGGESDSASTSDSESEREREERRRRRQEILAEKAAAKAVEAIKERENVVARLEGEKQSLEKILEERAKQQVQEASELQMIMMETMEAVELEKQKHNATRMEALGRLAKLETANGDLARTFANAQWNLELQVNQVAKLRQDIELKEATHEDLRRKISRVHHTGNKMVASKGVEFECEILEAECSFITDKAGRLKEKAKTLEASIKMTQKEMESPTEVEVELKRRLGQLTDHLIQKQAQVETLSSEKATLLLRIEAVSRLLEENKATDFAVTSSREDLESGIWHHSNSKPSPLFEQRIRSGKQHLGSLVRQLDSIFCAGSVLLRRNSTARTWSLVYLVCLHLWVLYILMSHSSVSDEARSGAVVSLENINYTNGV